MTLKKQTDDALMQTWANLGLPTRREQERMLHVLNQVQSRLMDLEERLEDALAAPPAPAARPSAPAPASPTEEAN